MYSRMLLILLTINLCITTTLVAICPKLDQVIADLLKEYQVPGVAVGICSDNEILFTQGYGLRDVEGNLPVTDKTIFSIASCTKAFTATLIGKLVDEGLIQWDKPVVDYLPEFRLHATLPTDQVTVRDLLAHRTGLSRNDVIWYCKSIGLSDVLTVLPHLKAAGTFREDLIYNNLTYAVAGLLIEKITGLSWQEAVKERILEPLDMKATLVSLNEIDQQPDVAFCYATIDGELTTFPYHPLNAIEPAGALNSNVTDLLKWVQMQLSGTPLIKPETRNELQTIQMKFSKRDKSAMGGTLEGFGMGWMIGTYGGCRLVTHTGAGPGFSSEVAFLPEKKLGLVVLTNSSTDGCYVVKAVRNTILDHLLELNDPSWISEIQTVREKSKNLLKADFKPISSLPTHPLEAYCGCYTHPGYGLIEVTLEERGLVAHYGTMELEFHHHTDCSFQTKICPLLALGINLITDVSFAEFDGKEFNEVSLALEPWGSPPVTFQRIENPLSSAVVELTAETNQLSEEAF